MSSELFSSHLSSSNLFSVQLFSASPFYAARLNSVLLSSPPLFPCQVCQVISTHPISSHLSFSSLLNSSQLMSAHLIHLLSSPQLFSALVSSSHLSSALLSALSDHLNSCPAQNLLQNQVSAPKYFRSFGKGISKGKCKVPKSRKIIKQLIVATLAQPFHQRFCHLYKEDCMDTLGIHMQLTWILQPQHGGLHGHARIHMDPSISASRIAPP